jgi:hypothetical protein
MDGGKARVRVPSLPCFTPAFLPELEVGQEGFSGCDAGDSSVVDCDGFENEAKDLVALGGVGFLLPEPAEVRERCGGLADIRDDRRLKPCELGGEDALPGVVLLAREVAEEVELFGAFELRFDRTAPCSFCVRR